MEKRGLKARNCKHASHQRIRDILSGGNRWAVWRTVLVGSTTALASSIATVTVWFDLSCIGRKWDRVVLRRLVRSVEHWTQADVSVVMKFTSFRSVIGLIIRSWSCWSGGGGEVVFH